MLSMKEMDF